MKKNLPANKRLRLGGNQQKVILLLLSGLALGLSRSPGNYFKIIKSAKKDWEKINERALKTAIKKLYESKLIKIISNKDKTITVTLTQEGKTKALTYNMSAMKIGKPTQWDKKWRLVMFDIPEKRRRGRDALRFHLKDLGFFEYQKSVFAHPFECRDEIDYLIEFYDMRKHVRMITAETLDNELHLRAHFNKSNFNLK